MNDETYMLEIVPSTLAGYQSRVANQEAGGSEFVDSRVSPLDNRSTNLAMFKHLAPGQPPATPGFVKLGELPAGKTALWTGVVLIDGRNLAVQMFR